jgi:excisionase family DNA binding protein
MKEVYTTGEVAKICNVTIRTVIKWFESGVLKGFKIPNSRDRRIPRENLVVFMKENGFPLNKIETSNRKRILIADDEEGILYVLKKFLSDIGIFDVETALSGYEAGVKTISFRPHVLVLDHLLGDTTSREVSKSLRANPDFKELKIIVMSGYLTDDEVEEMLHDGVQEFIRKPFDLQEVKQKVFRLLDLL